MVADHEMRAAGVFLNSLDAEPAFSELKAAGFPMDQLSVIAKQAEESAQLGEVETTNKIGDKNVNKSTGISTDAVNNATWGTLLVGLTSLSLFGAGPVLAAGTLAAALVSGVAGSGIEAAGARNLTKALAELGIPEEHAKFYVDRLVQGNYLVLVEGTAAEIKQAGDIFARHSIRSWNTYNALASAN